MSDVAAQHIVTAAIARAPDRVPAWTVALLAIAGGLIVANIYYAQPLIGPIAASLNLTPAAAGLIVTMTQIGYVAGLLLIVPLGDLFETRRLVVALTVICSAALLAAGLCTHPLPFLAAALVLGLATVTVQIMVPYAAHLAPEATRGRVVGTVMSGLMFGIMLARPASSFVAHLASWRAIFFLSAGLMVVVAGVLWRALPPRQPAPGIGYGRLLISMVRLVVETPVLRRRALYQAALFGVFSLFWTCVPLLLLGPAYRFTQTGVGIFALAGAGGGLVAPLAGWLADRGWSRWATGGAMLAASAAFLLSHLGRTGAPSGVAALVAAAVLVDVAVTTNLIMGQRAIFILSPAHRSRLNGLYMAMFFVGGALGSALGGWAFARDGWAAVTWIGALAPLLALAYFATELLSGRPIAPTHIAPTHIAPTHIAPTHIAR